MTQNPYQTPSIEYQGNGVSRISALVRSVGPAVISAALTIVFWMTFALVFGLLMLSVNEFVLMIVWSMSLLISMSTATLLVSGFWQRRSVPLAYGFVYAVFAIVFYVLVLIPSRDMDQFEAVVVYGTLAVLPILASILVYCLGRLKSQRNNEVGIVSRHR